MPEFGDPLYDGVSLPLDGTETTVCLQSGVTRRVTTADIAAVAEAFVTAAVAALVDAAPGTLDTLNELAAALGDDANFAATVTTALAGKQPLDADLTAIAGLSPAANDVVQFVSGAWANRTMAQLRTALAVTGADVANTPAGTIASTTVQAAINELGTEKAALAGAAFTGNVTGTTSGWSVEVSAPAVTMFSVTNMDMLLRMQNSVQRWDVFINTSDGQAWQVRDVTNGKTVLRCLPNGSTTLSAGASVGFAAVGGTIFNWSVDGNSLTTAETDLYSNTIAASTLSANNHKLEARYDGIFAANTTTKRLKIYFAGTVIYDSGALAVAATLSTWTVKVRIIRVSATVVRCTVDYAGAVAAAPQYTEVTGLTLTDAQTLKITGTAGAGGANNDIVAKMATVDFKPAA